MSKSIFRDGMTNITFIIPGPPVPKARPRVGRNGAYTPKRTKEYEAKVRALALVARQKAKQRVWTGPVAVEATFYIETPPERRPDCDNYLKTLLDGCKGVIYEDDAQITDIVAKKRRVFLGVKPETSVMLWRTDA